MRPGRCHPGNLYPAAGRGLQESSFNEAGALPPRKYADGNEYRVAVTQLQ